MSDSLLSGILPAILRAGNAARKNVRGLLTDPVNTIDNLAGSAAADLQEGLGAPNFTASILKQPHNPAAIQGEVDKMAGMFAGVGMFSGPKRATAEELKALARARVLRKQDPKAETWERTGWMQTPDKSWMSEIDDSKAKLFKTKDGSVALDHPELFARYPELAQYKIKIGGLPENIKGLLDWENKVIRLNDNLPQDQRLNVLLHEFQHPVDRIEKRASGANFASGDTMDQIAHQVRYAKKASDTAEAAHQAQNLLRQGLSPKEAGDFVASNSGVPLDDDLLNHLLRNPQMIPDDRALADSVVSQLRKANAQPDAYQNYLREPSEVRARTTQHRQFLNKDQRRMRDPARDMKYFINNPVAPDDQLKLFDIFNPPR